MSDTTPLTTEKAANYSARAGQTIAGNLVRGGDGKFSSGGGGAPGKVPSKQSYGAKRAAANAKLQQRLAARRAAAAAKKAKPKGGKGKAKPKAAAKPKANTAQQRLAEAAKRRAERERAALQRKTDRAAERSKREVERKVAAAGREAAKLQKAQDRANALAAKKAELAKRKIDAQAKRAAAAANKPKGGGGGKPKAAPDKAAALAANRTKVQAATLDGAAFSALQGMVDGTAPAAGGALDALVKSGLVERDSAGGYRISQAGRSYTNAADAGDVGRARDAMSRAADRVARREAIRSRRTDAPTRGALQPATKERKPDRVTSAGHSGVMIYLPIPSDVQAQIAQLDGVTQPAEELHITLVYLGKSDETALATNKARILDAVAEWSAGQSNELTGAINGYGRFLTAEDGDTNAVYLSPDLPGLPALRASLVDMIGASGFDYSQDHGYTPHITVAYVPQDESTPALKPDDITLGINAISVAWGDEQYDYPLGTPATKETSLTVFKQANGRYRWIGVSSTAYEDRDGEIVSTKALDEDCDRADQDGQYGPLRFWHMPGADLGTTDYNAVFGRSLVESGEFYDSRIGAAFATSKEHWQMSLGFLHGRDQPADGIYTRIRRFERSILPASAASNPFTSLIIHKGTTMSTTDQKAEKLKETLAGLPDGDEILAKLLAGVDKTEKAAQAAGVRYKAADAEPDEEAPADAPEVEEKAAEPDGGDMTGDEAAEDEPAGTILEDADLDAIAERVEARLFDRLAPLLEGMAATTKGAQAQLVMPSNLEAVLDGFLMEATSTKEAAQAAQADAKAATTKAGQVATTAAKELATLKQRVAELEGDQPRGNGYRASEDEQTIKTKATIGPNSADGFTKAIMEGADFLIS